MDESIETALQTHGERALQRLHAAGCAWPEAATPMLQKVELASDFAVDVLQAQPAVLAQLLADAHQPLPPPQLSAENREQWAQLLRRYRRAESTRLIWRDVVEAAPVEDILAGSSVLAEGCLQQALTALGA